MGIEEIRSVIASIYIIALALTRVLPYPWDCYAAVILVLAGILGIVHEYNHKKRLDKKMSKSRLFDILNDVRHSVKNARESNTKTLRIAIMKMGENRLQVVQELGTPNGFDCGVAFAIGEGICGKCAEESSESAWGNYSEVFRETYEETCQANGGKPPWNLTREQWEYSKDYANGLCIAIYDRRDNDKLIAMILLEDKIALEDSKLNDDCLIEKVIEDLYPLAEIIMEHL